MKLPDFTEDVELLALLRSMGASPRAYVAPAPSGQLSGDEINRLAREGIEIPLDEVRILEDGTLAYKNQRVVLYIRDQKQYHRSDDDALPKFHVSNCDKLREMRANNRYDRYVVSTRETGQFQINRRSFNATRYKQSEESLAVCQFCLSFLDWRQFKRARKNALTRREVVSNFSLKEYFDEYGRTLFSKLPMHTDETAPLNDYTPDFRIVADRLKAARKFRCDNCGIDLSKFKRYLHAHHKNGLQYDNTESNIAILCIEDHARQYAHPHVKYMDAYKEFIALRASGKIAQPTMSSP
jgi:hypothetical protein